jgi:hypothetical protein
MASQCVQDTLALANDFSGFVERDSDEKHREEALGNVALSPAGA